MEIQNIQVLCLRARDVNPYLLGKFDEQNNFPALPKQIEVQYADCECCGEQIVSKTKLNLAGGKCLHCV